MRHTIRNFALWLKSYTDNWIVPRALHDLIDCGDYAAALRMLDDAQREWPGDPEITQYRTLIHFLSSDER